MTSDQANAFLMTSAVVTIGSTVVGGQFVHPPTAAGAIATAVSGSLVAPIVAIDALQPRVVIGTLITFTALSIIAEVMPEVAAGLSFAVAGTAFVNYGLPALIQFFGLKATP